MGDRWDNEKKWNLHEEDRDTGAKIVPQLSVLGQFDEVVEVEFPYFGNEREERVIRRMVPAKRIKTKDGEILVQLRGRPRPRRRVRFLVRRGCAVHAEMAGEVHGRAG